MMPHLDRESRKSIGDALVVVVVFVAVMLAFAVTARCEPSAALTMPRTDSDFAAPVTDDDFVSAVCARRGARAGGGAARRSGPEGDPVHVSVEAIGIEADLSFPVRVTPGIREIWAAPTNARDFSPSAEDFARVAGSSGYVVALSPERAEHVVATLEAARDEAAACRLEVDAQAALIDSLRKQVATLEAAHVTDGADILRMDDLTRSQRAMLRPRRGLAFAAGMAVGAGLVAGGVAVSR